MKFRVKRKLNGLWYVQSKLLWMPFWITVEPPDGIWHHGFQYRETAEELKVWLEKQQ